MSADASPATVACPFCGGLDWHYLPELPDADITVLVSCHGEGDCTEGYYDGDHWRRSSGTRMHGVYAWADMPDAAPVRARKGGAS